MKGFLACAAFLRRHPAVRDALLWALPAVVFGAVLRVALTICLPYAFWGADSRSYFSFAHRLIVDHAISLDEKRRYFYPIFLVPISLLPGIPLRWLAIVQHTVGVVTLWPLAYVVRKVFGLWRVWVVPVTVLYAALPVMVWYEHELLGENIFFAALMWSFAGWVAWIADPLVQKPPGRFWWFFIPFAAFILTKPSGRFVWPGILVGLIVVQAWRRLRWKQTAALVVLGFVTLTVGSRKQGAWLLYTATFALTELETPLHGDYKAEIRDLVEPLRQHPGAYYLLDDVPFAFLEDPTSQGERPLWNALASDSREKMRLYMDLALEGIRAHPTTFLYFGLQRAISSANLSQFKRDRFTGRYFRERTEHFYAEGEREEGNRVRLAFGLPALGPIPSYAEFRERLDPRPSSFLLQVVQRFVGAVGDSLDFTHMPRGGPREERVIERARPTVLGCWLLLSAVTAVGFRRYRSTLGVWTVIAFGYLFGVFLVSQQNARYFAPAWVVLVPLLAAPADVVILALKTTYQRRSIQSGPRGTDWSQVPRNSSVPLDAPENAGRS